MHFRALGCFCRTYVIDIFKFRFCNCTMPQTQQDLGDLERWAWPRPQQDVTFEITEIGRTDNVEEESGERTSRQARALLRNHYTFLESYLNIQSRVGASPFWLGKNAEVIGFWHHKVNKCPKLELLQECLCIFSFL